MGIREIIEQGTADFRKQRNEIMVLNIVPVFAWDKVLRKARKGDNEALNIALVVGQWMLAAGAAEREGELPGCVCCDNVIHKGKRKGEGDVFAWMTLLPSQGDGTGLVAPICYRCERLGRDEVTRRIKIMLANEFGCTVEHVQ